MKLIKGILVVVGLTSLLLTKPVLAGDGKTLTEKVVVEQEEARKWWGASLSTGWDSLYMFRGVNVLRFDQDGNGQIIWSRAGFDFIEGGLRIRYLGLCQVNIGLGRIF